MIIINFEKKKKVPLTNKGFEPNAIQESCHVYRKIFEDKYADDKKYHLVRDRCFDAAKYRGAEYSLCNLKYSIPNYIPIAFIMN